MFEPLVKFFRLKNLPATFQTMMNKILKEYIDNGVIIVYMDDNLIFTFMEKENIKITKNVLEILEDNDLFLKLEKCLFNQKKINYLGLIISEDGVSMDEMKIEVITSWPTPKNVKELQSFIRFTNFYRRFIEDFLEIMNALHKLTRKNTSWMWNKEQKVAFNGLKDMFKKDTVLIYSDIIKKFKIEADASGFASGGILSILYNNGKWRPCAFISKGFGEVERNYNIHDREMLSIMRALKEWRQYLEGCKIPFTI